MHKAKGASMGEMGFKNGDEICGNENIWTVTRPTMKRARVNNFVKWDRGWWHKYKKQASSSSPIYIADEDSGYARGARVPESPLGC